MGPRVDDPHAEVASITICCTAHHPPHPTPPNRYIIIATPPGEEKASEVSSNDSSYLGWDGHIDLFSNDVLEKVPHDAHHISHHTTSIRDSAR